jgi:predicted permease
MVRRRYCRAMQAILSVTIPFFALVWLGLLAARSGALPLDAVPGLNSFVLFFALPCMLFRFGYSLPLAELLDPVVITVYLLCALIVVVFTVAVTLSPRVPMKDAAFGALVGAFPNSGFMGVPLLAAIAGPGAAGPVLSSLLCDLFITSSLCIALAQSREERNTLPAHGPGHGVIDSHLPDEELTPDASLASRLALAWRLTRATLANPLPWSIALGAACGALGIVLPGPVDRIIAMLGDAASPVALFTIGAVLWRAKIHAQELQAALGAPDTSGIDPARLATSRFALARHHAALLGGRNACQLLRPDLPVALVKLLLHPLLVLLVGLAARELGAPLSGFQLAVLVMTAALPSASNVAVLAERYGADSGRVVRIIMASTALSFVSFSVIAWSFGMQPR